MDFEEEDKEDEAATVNEAEADEEEIEEEDEAEAGPERVPALTPPNNTRTARTRPKTDRTLRSIAAMFATTMEGWDLS